MTIIQTNEFRTGMKVIIENNLCEILEHQFHKPGKGQAVMRVKYKNLMTSQVLDKTFKTGESVEKADIEVTKNAIFVFRRKRFSFHELKHFRTNQHREKLNRRKN